MDKPGGMPRPRSEAKVRSHRAVAPAVIAEIRSARKDIERMLTHHLEMPFSGFGGISPRSRRLITDVVHLGVGQFISRAAGVEPPDAEFVAALCALGRAEAELRDDLTRLRVAWREATKESLHRIGRLCVDQAVDAASLAALNDLLLELTDTFYFHLETGFSATRRVRAGEASTRRTFTAETGRDELERLFAELGITAPEEVIVVVVEDRLGRAPLDPRSLGRNVLTWTGQWQTRVVADAARDIDLRPLLLDISRTAVVAVAGPVSLDLAGTACGWALRMLQLRREGNLPSDHFMDCRDLADALLLESDRALRHELVKTTLAPMMNLKCGPRRVLAETLLSWLVTKSAPAVGDALEVHFHTVHYRIGQLRRLFGDDFDDPDTQRRMVVALSAVLQEWRAADSKRRS